jgi:hypothetical protein
MRKRIGRSSARLCTREPVSATQRQRVVDAFLFCDEAEMLEIRLNVLDAVVDRFVLVESTVTFSGLPKPLHYADHRSRYARWSDRIEHVVVDDTPDTGAWRWGREHHQRNAIARGLAGCRCDDFVMLSDVDEIPDPEAVAARTRGGYHQDFFLYYLNARHVSEDWIGTVGLYAFQLAAHGAQAVRDRRHGYERVERGGWHFAYAMPPDRIRRKLRAFSHAEYDTPEHAEAIERRRERLEDIFAVHPGRLTVQDLATGYFPDYVKQRWRDYADLVRAPSVGSPDASLGRGDAR